jgi:hypothetical protein
MFAFAPLSGAWRNIKGSLIRIAPIFFRLTPRGRFE